MWECQPWMPGLIIVLLLNEVYEEEEMGVGVCSCGWGFLIKKQ